MLSKNRLFTALLLSFGFGSVVGSATAAEGEKVDFARQVQPLLVENCARCHGEKKKLAKLQLHTAKAIQGFHEENLVVAGKPDESELFERITLPEDNKKRMPKGAPPLKKEQIDLIRRWIAEGASFTSAEAPKETKAETPTPEPPAKDASQEASAEPVEIPDDAEELADVKPAADEAVTLIEQAGATVMSLFADSPLLQVSFAQAPSPADDKAIATLPTAREQIVWLNLSGAQASSEGYAPLAELTNISQLHLEKSTIDDAALANLADLDRLHYLNLYGTNVTDAGLEHLKGLKRLRKLYLWKTQVSYDAAMALQEATPGLEVNLGWNHPEVARRRLTKQLDVAKKQSEESAKAAEEAQKQLDAAKKEKEQADARLQEIQKELDALNKPNESEEKAEEKPAEEKPEEKQEA